MHHREDRAQLILEMVAVVVLSQAVYQVVVQELLF
jgi:hypothetical protein